LEQRNTTTYALIARAGKARFGRPSRQVNGLSDLKSSFATCRGHLQHNRKYNVQTDREEENVPGN